jgi:UDP:flavonoid glycosyltransferase YjiC (YdhE family)
LVSRQVVVVETAPQLQILERADVFVTHGGLGSVRESVTSGVPMLVIPLTHDQPGNGARIRYHGLGVVGSARELSIRTLSRLLHTLLDDDTSLRAVRRMQAIFQRHRNAGAGVDVLRKLADGEGTHGPNSQGR